MKILFTGTHFSPILAVIEELPANIDFFVVLRKHALEGDEALSYEYRVCKERGIPFRALDAGRLQRSGAIRIIPSILKTMKACWAIRSVLKKEQPDIVASFGGYISLPVSLAAKSLGIPIVIHEQTQEAGLANKIIGKFADAVCISFESSRKYFPEPKVVLTGNPVRKSLFVVNKKIPFTQKDRESGLNVLYITGGSTGSHFINKIVAKLLPSLLDKFCIIHQTGEAKEFSDFDALVAIRSALPLFLKKRYILKKFILPEEIGWVMKTADLIISRSGINTMLEVLALGKPFIFIPLPHGQKNEQLNNARLAASTGLGIYIEQKNATPNYIHEKVKEIIQNKRKYASHAKNALQYALPTAASNIINSIQLVHAKTPRRKT